MQLVLWCLVSTLMVQFGDSQETNSLVPKVPVKTNISLDKTEFSVDSDISIPCDVDGNPLPKVIWYKDNEILHPSEKIQISESSRLTVVRASAKDTGTYKCEAANEYSSSHSEVNITVEADTMVWKISNFSAKMEDARAKKPEEQWSPFFYTSKFGYKLRAEALLNGMYSTENKNVTLFIWVLPGEFDETLRWPFTCSVEITLVDPSEKASNIVHRYTYDSSSGKRPNIRSLSPGHGILRVVPVEALAKGQFIKDDTIVFRIKVDC